MTVDVRAQLQSALGSAYDIERELGGGGMSRVFLATETRLGRRVVVKILSPDLSAGVSADRFEREIRLAARLQHPHIVPLLTAGDLNGLPFYTMPFIDGASLRERLVAGPLPYAEAQSILRDVARALAYAHKQGIVHRDIKPENVLLAEGIAMVADFGVARALSAATAVADERGTLTQVGTQIGTPAYMSPEQAAGDPDVDFRADLYAFGVMAYELLAGAHPFAEKRSAQALVIAHLTEQPQPLGTRTTEVAPMLSTLIMQCLGKDPIDRPESASAIVRALDTPSAPNVIAAPVPPAAASPTIAVLPFTNMSGDADNEYFSDGITDDIIGALTQVNGLRVAARASAFSFKGKNEELAVIGQKLGVRTVLMGSVRRAGKRVRVSAQLMNTRDGFQLWSERYDRDLEDIFAIQDEIARNIVERLEITLGLKVDTSLVVRPTDDLEAYQLYLRGREAVQQRTTTSMRRGLDFFKEALRRDPTYARAHLGVAEAYVGLGVYQYVPESEAVREAELALAEAARLQPDLASLFTQRAQLKLYLRADWPTAIDDCVHALRHNPNDALAHAYLALANGLLQRWDSCTAASKRAIECDPLSPFVRAVSVIAFLSTDDPEAGAEAALVQHDEALALDPNSVLNLWISAVRLGDLGRLDEALHRMSRAVELSQRGPLIISMYARLLNLAGRREDTLALQSEIDAMRASRYIGPVCDLLFAIVDGNEDGIARALQLNIDSGTGPTTIATSGVDRELNQLLSDPRLGPLIGQLSYYAGRASVQS
jgi:serine/threonine protein kinase/tetratricopeptide (TPR) repeat protein